MLKKTMLLAACSAVLLSACVVPTYYDDGYSNRGYKQHRNDGKDHGKKHRHPGNSAYGHSQGRGPHR